MIFWAFDPEPEANMAILFFTTQTYNYYLIIGNIPLNCGLSIKHSIKYCGFLLRFSLK